MLRRQFKKAFGYKPCNLSEEEIEREIAIAEKAKDLQAVMPKSDAATIGDLVKNRGL